MAKTSYMAEAERGEVDPSAENMHIMDFPYEILLAIFKFLSHRDLLVAEQTCHLWYEIANNAYFLKKQRFYLTQNAILNENCIDNLLNSQKFKKLNHLTFKAVDFSLANVSKISAIWEARQIKHIDFLECEINERKLVEILNCCPSLESLSFDLSGTAFYSALCRLDRNNVKNIKRLNFTKTAHLTETFLNQFFLATSKLEEFEVSDCALKLNDGNATFFYYTYSYFLKRGHYMKKICFNKTTFDDASLSLISKIPHLKLTSFQIYGCDKIYKEGLLALISHQTNLTDLNVGLTRLTDELLTIICDNMKNLKTLNISKCESISNAGAVILNKLKKLQNLDISHCLGVTALGIENGICKEKNYNLTELNISVLHLTEQTIILVSENLPNLKSLMMKSCINSVNNKSIQAVFKNLPKLNALSINYCDSITDEGLTGLDKQLFKNLKGNVLSEAQIKSTRGNVLCGYSLLNLRNLKRVELSGCKKITNNTLIFAFNHAELKQLYLNNCQEITFEGLICLSTSCPFIETLELINCRNISDTDIKEIIKNLHRLKYLDLRDCENLTDESIRAIYREHKTLSVLDVSYFKNR